ncbi:hypothetical protein [Pseudomonas entomophila]|uniref:hypothetical protein n=1 Tax=Pseudomonas entomophila TaxID=312306 RepID=UPI004046FF57
MRTLDKLRGEIKYDDEVNSQLCSRDTGLIRTSKSFRCDPAANQLEFDVRQFDTAKDNWIRQWQGQKFLLEMVRQGKILQED